MTINTDVQSTSGSTPEEIREKVEETATQVKEKARGAAHEVAGRAREMKRLSPSANVLRSSLLMSGAALGSILVAAAIRRVNPFEPIESIGEGMRFVGRHERRMFHPRSLLTGLGAIIGGSMILAAVNDKIGRKVSDRPILRGGLATLSSLGLDLLLLGPQSLGKLVKTLGLGGTALKYGSIGGAYSLGSRGEKGESGEESYHFEREGTGSEPFYSGSEVGTVAGSPEHPQPIV